MDELISRQDAIKAICEDGTWLERQGCTEITMAERKQRDADILSALPPVNPNHNAGVSKMVDDLISRQAAIDALATYIYNVYKAMIGKRMPTDKCKQAAESVLGELPTVQPKRMNGEWNKIHWKAFRCSECNRVSEYHTNFCPNCGANMMKII